MSETVDLTRLPAPTILEEVSYETLLAEFKARFVAQWAVEVADDPTLPMYDVDGLETDPAVIGGEAWSTLRMLDRQRVNDAIEAVLAPTATGADLDNVVARIGVVRLVVVPATETTAAVMETDERLLTRYLLAFSRPAAGSAERYLYEAMTAWPALWHAAVIGRAIHGRRGDVDLVVAGPQGRDPTDAELTLVRTACGSTSVKPEATALNVLRATRRIYTVAGRLVVPAGPDAEAVRTEATARIAAAALARTRIGAEVPVQLLAGAAYGLSVTRCDLTEPAADIPADVYTIPVLAGVALTVEVAA